MASDAQETLYKIFAGLAGGPAAGSGGGLASGAIGSAISAATPEKENGSGAGQMAQGYVKQLLPIVSLVTGLIGLFRDDEDQPTPLVKYALPERREFQAAATPSGFADVDYDQWGLPRAAEAPASSSQAGGPAQITVNVQAMDARSFLDRSSDIAAAVREAMLNLNSINDVVTDL